MVLQAGGVQAQGGLRKQPTEAQLRQEVQGLNSRIADLAHSLGPEMTSATLARTTQQAAILGQQRDRAMAQLARVATPLQGAQATRAQAQVNELNLRIAELNARVEPHMTSAELAQVRLQVGVLESQRGMLEARLGTTAATSGGLPPRASASDIPALEARMKALGGEMAGLVKSINDGMTSAQLVRVNARIDQISAEMDKVGAKLTVARGQANASGDQLQLASGAPAKPGEAEALQKDLVKIHGKMARLGNAINDSMTSAQLAKIQGELGILGQQVDAITNRLKEIQAQGVAVDPLAAGVRPFGEGLEPDGRPLGLKSSGPRVEAVQQFLSDNGYGTGNVDGKYGPATAKGVKDFQTALGLKVDGVAGPNTLRAMAIMQAVKAAKSAAESGTSSEQVAAFEALNQAQAELAKLPAGERTKLDAEVQGAQRVLGPVVDPDVLADGIGDALDQAPDASREVVELSQADRSGFWGWLFGANSGAIVEKVNAGEITTEAGRSAARARLADDMMYSPAEAQAYGRLLADSVKAGALSPEQLMVEIAKYDSRTKGDDVVRSLVAELDYTAVKALPKEIQLQLLDALPPRLSYADVTGGVYDPERQANQRTREILEAGLRGDATPPNQWASTWSRQDFHLLA